MIWGVLATAFGGWACCLIVYFNVIYGQDVKALKPLACLMYVQKSLSFENLMYHKQNISNISLPIHRNNNKKNFSMDLICTKTAIKMNSHIRYPWGNTSLPLVPTEAWLILHEPTEIGGREKGKEETEEIRNITIKIM